MSIVHSRMLDPLVNSFEPGHMRSRSYSELMTQFRSSLAVPGLSLPYVKKRSHSDMLKSTSCSDNEPQIKRSRTAPTTPPATLLLKSSAKTMRSRSLSPNKRLFPERKKPVQECNRTKLPGIASLNIPTKVSVPPITPTISLDYFDTYKPHDEHWKYGLLDSIQKSKNDLSRYSYLNHHAASKPLFDSRLSSKITNPPANNVYQERKINFPYESNYTYLNQTYKRDIEKYPEYLELAHSLISLSRNQTLNQTLTNQLQLPQQPPLVPATSQHQHIYHGSFPYSRQKNHDTHHYERANHHHQHRPHYHDHHHYNGVLASLPTPTSSTMQLPATGSFSSYQPSIPYSRHPSDPEIRRLPTTPAHSPQAAKFIPITPPSMKSKSRSDLLKSPPKASQIRVCISCGSDQSPCWRPSWSIREGQLCNSCGLRYKKTSARCLNQGCKKIPAKGEWSLMLGKGKSVFEDGEEGYSCLDCGSRVEVAK